MKILLDTNFIITCARQKIDFDAIVNGLTTEEVSWVIPQEVLAELRGLKHSNKMHSKEQAAIGTGLEMIQKINYEVLPISDKSVDVDTKIVNYIKDKPIILATLDKDLKKRVRNKILTIKGMKSLQIIEQ